MGVHWTHLAKNSDKQRRISWLAAALILPHDRLRPTLPCRPTTAPCSDGWPNTIFVLLNPYCTIPCFFVVTDKDSKFIYDFKEHKSLNESEQKPSGLRFQRVADVTSQKGNFALGEVLELLRPHSSRYYRWCRNTELFQARGQNCDKRLLTSSPSVLTQQLVSLWMDIHDIWYEYFSKTCRGN